MKFDFKSKKAKTIYAGVAVAVVAWFGFATIYNKITEDVDMKERIVSLTAHELEMNIYQMEELVNKLEVNASDNKKLDEEIANVKKEIIELRKLNGFTVSKDGTVDEDSTGGGAYTTDMINQEVEHFEVIIPKLDTIISTLESDEKIKTNEEASKLLEELQSLEVSLNRSVTAFNGEDLEAYNKGRKNFLIQPAVKNRGWVTIDSIDVK